jgi:hypothetical protein
MAGLEGPRLVELFRRFRQEGGCVDYVLLEPCSHADAATRFMTTLRERLAWPELTFDGSRAVGTTIDRDRFFGPRFDRTTQQLVLGGSVSSPSAGYAYAFSDPPYRLQLEPPELNGLFVEINRELFGTGNLDIVEWSTDWSSYFDAGHEWWGAFLWTVKPSERDHMIAIGASSTD